MKNNIKFYFYRFIDLCAIIILTSGFLLNYDISNFITILTIVYSIAIISLLLLYILKTDNIMPELSELACSFKNDKYDVFGYKIYYNYALNGIMIILSALNEEYFLSMIIIAFMLCFSAVFIFENEKEKEIKND